MEMRNYPLRSRPQCSHHQRQQSRRLEFKQRSYKGAAGVFGLLCILLVVAVIILAIKYTQQQIHYETLSDKLQITNKKLTKQINELSRTKEIDQHNLTKQIDHHNLNKQIEDLKLAKQDEHLTLTKQINQLQEENAALQRMLTDKAEQARLGWIYFSSSLYFISTQTKSWSDSREDCKRNGADLVIIKTKEEQNFLVKQLCGDRAWIGLHDRGTEGIWKWVDDTPLTTVHWAPGEPNDKDNEDCAEIWGFTGRDAWNDRPCGNKVRWICEKPVAQ